MPKQLMFGDEARRKVRQGLEQLARAVKITLGPTGRNVILRKSFGSPVVTKDGVTVAKEVELLDPFENMGAKMVNEVASKTSDVAGDGTTTATVLAQAIYEDGLRTVTSGAEPVALKRGIDKAVHAAVEALEKISRKVKDKTEIAHVGTISANGDEQVGQLLADALEKVGQDGVITVEEGKTTDTTLEFVEGMQFDKGYISPYFMTNPQTSTCELENALILLHEKKISNVRDLLPLLERVAQAGAPFVIIAEDVDSEALALLVVNKLRGVLPCVAVKAPAFGDRRKAMLEDMAIMTGGRLISEELGVKLENVSLDDLGRAKRVVVDKDTTTLIEGAGKKSAIQARIAQIRHQIETTTSDYDREKLQERLAKIVGGVAIIKVGAPTETAMKERKARVEDALHATRSAVQEGIVPGGGVAFLKLQPAVRKLANQLESSEKTGAEIIYRALEEPLRQIAANSGQDGSVIIEEVREKGGNFGYDARSGKLVDMLEAGILDPTKVTRSALQHAASIAGLMLLTETLVTDLKEETEGGEKAPAIEGSVR